MKLTFNKLKNAGIFQDEFEDFTQMGNNIIEFKKQPNANGGIAVLYAPNGTGKSSFADVLGLENATIDQSFEAENENNVTLNPESKAFHIIPNQIERNIIPGDTSDYLIGPEIRREYELKKKITEGFISAFKDTLPKKFNKDFKVSKLTDYLLKQIEINNQKAYEYIKDIINRQNHGKSIIHKEFIDYIRDKSHRPQLLSIDSDIHDFIINECPKSKLISNLINLNLIDITTNSEISVIEENDDAICLLNKYKDNTSCIVCDNTNIDAENLLSRKMENRKRIYESLDKKTKALFDDIMNDESLKMTDPLMIKQSVLEFLSSGNTKSITELQKNLSQYVEVIADEMIVAMEDIFNDTSMFNDFDTLTKIQENNPELDSEELQYIQEIINENLDKNITIIRDKDNDNNYKLLFDNNPLLNVDRHDLHLSTGEQNFISLAFSLLYAKNSDKEYVVIDDPISSFDSVYKNKIAYCILKFLENKKQIILTHNTDLIRLLEVQMNGCFNLYFLNNCENGVNGFLRVNNQETKILINLYELIKFFQNKGPTDNNNNYSLKHVIKNERLFLISMIPFMRGYAHISNNNDSDHTYEKLSKIMHGYGSSTLDIAAIYYDLFKYRIVTEQKITTNDILTLNDSDSEILDNNTLPLLNQTLKQTLKYYHLRMFVEKKLVDIFDIPFSENDPPMLNQLITKAFPYNDICNDENSKKIRSFRVFFTSRKTLLNEFNHFEGNMNIFQPAIDIKPSSLNKEVKDVKDKLVEAEEWHNNIH